MKSTKGFAPEHINRHAGGRGTLLPGEYRKEVTQRPETRPLTADRDREESCKSRGVRDARVFRPAMCFCMEDAPFHIVLAEEQTDDMISFVKTTMECNGFARGIPKLDTDAKHLEHLVLHEIACVILNTIEQSPRDEWAFREMGM